MTSIVKITAHCAANKAVRITVYDKISGDVNEVATLEDGQSTERYTFDNRAVKVEEFEKEAPISE